MIPVMQTKFGNEEGNCFAAAIASVLEVKLEDLPNLNSAQNKEWFRDLWNFLVSHGFSYRGDIHNEAKILAYDKGVNGYYVVNGKSPRGYSRGHAVVYHKGKFVHDPYPGGNGILSLDWALKIELMV